MKKLFVIGAMVIGTMASAFQFRSSCGMVFQLDNWSISHLTHSQLNYTLSQLNFNACGVHPTSITYYP